MKRTTIFISEELERDLHAYARRSGKPAAAIVREAIAAYLVSGPQAQALPSFAGAFDSGHTDTAEKHEDLLFTALTPHGVRPKRSAPKPSARRPARHTGASARSRR